MNSGLQDAFNLAWKLALVCQGHCASTLLDSYEPERRPVAEGITATGEAFEQAQDLTDRAERRARDETLRATFANPASKHHESIAEAELDIDYSASPIVLGDEHATLAAGQRLPDTISVAGSPEGIRWLHELAHRAGHTALLFGGKSVPADELSRLASSLQAEANQSLIEATFVLTTCEDNADDYLTLPETAAEQLGIRELTLLVIRPDGHVGLRADRDHVPALADYQGLLMGEFE